MRAQFRVSPAALAARIPANQPGNHGSSGHPRNISVYNWVLFYAKLMAVHTLPSWQLVV